MVGLRSIERVTVCVCVCVCNKGIYTRKRQFKIEIINAKSDFF
jgi:hypothetical protein